MATWEDVRRIAQELPETAERSSRDGLLSWLVRAFEGYPAVLVQLDRIAVPDLRELMVEAWLDRAPKRLAKAYLAGDAGR